ncbi:hypothetical protein BSKO_06466 [Bryopsis sp. KO-2023]|nr:hypothetical protein BSKO_06466 [Bryopsis sp. KO-2023]
MLCQQGTVRPLASRQTAFLRGNSVGHGVCSASPRSRSVSVVSARYRGKGGDFSKVHQFRQSPSDCGSSQFQIARLSARVDQLTTHLQTHKKDYASERGLKLILSQRKRLLFYLYNNDRSEFEKVIADLGIRFSAKKFSAST